MVVSLDMRRLNAIEWIDAENQAACVQAGILGGRLQELLAEQGFTSGHEPDSMELSTLGGWVPTAASRMKPQPVRQHRGHRGERHLGDPVRRCREPVRHAAPVRRCTSVQGGVRQRGGAWGWSPRRCCGFTGCPKAKRYGSMIFADWGTGVAFMAALNQTGAKPASIRLVDNVQFRLGQALKPAPTDRRNVLTSQLEKFIVTWVKGFDPHQMVAATMVLEGSKDEVEYQHKVKRGTAKKFGGISGGAGNGEQGYMLTYAIAYIRDLLADYYIVGETYETTVP